MEKPGTINVVGEDKALEISRAIIRTHEYVIQNVAVLNDRERGYMFNEYFPAVKDYLIFEPDVLVPAKPEDLKVFIGDSVGKHYPQPTDADIFTEEFRYNKDVQLLGFNLSYIPDGIRAVWIASDKAGFDEPNRFLMQPTGDYIYNLTTGAIDFPTFFLPEGDKKKLINVFETVKATQYFSIFVEYARVDGPVPTPYLKQAKPYAVGEDGET